MEKNLDNSISGASVGEGHNHDQEDISKALRDDEFKLAIAEVNEVKLENARLKMLLQQIEQDYTSLQTRYFNICKPDLKKSVSPTCTRENIADEEESELVSLRLGRSLSPRESKNVDKKRSYDKTREDYHHSCDNNKSIDGLKLGLDYSNGVSESDLVKPNKDPSPGSASEVIKTMNESVKKIAGDDEVSQPNVKRARVSVRTKCDYPTINDGCQWRKYGQKISRGNPCPRSYYRCSVAPSCPVRKQVQRCLEDMSILITTYEGTHNHSLPIEATAMASATSAAASMLLSGSSSSQSAKNLPNLPNYSKTAPLYLSNNSSSNPFPTITLDFTTFPTTSSFTSFNFPSNFQYGSGFLSNSLSFSSPESATIPKKLGSGCLNYDSASTLPYHKNLINIGSSQKQFDRPFIGKDNTSSDKLKEDSSQQALTETLTKAITSDPSFQSVLAAAISSMVGATKT